VPKKIKIYHIGGSAWENTSVFDYTWLSSGMTFWEESKAHSLFVDERLNPKASRALFFFEDWPLVMCTNPDLWRYFPAYQIFYAEKLALPKEIQHVLLLKVAYAVEPDAKMLQTIFLQNYGSGQMGYKLSDASLESTSASKLIKRGGTFEISTWGIGSAKQVALWRELHLIQAGESLDFYPELRLKTPASHAFFKIFYLKGAQIQRVERVEAEAVFYGERIRLINTSGEDLAFQVALYLEGVGEMRVKVGQIHIRKSLWGSSCMIPGGEHITDPEDLGRDIFFYFNPGDMKPPLSVYFSGFRTAEGFEGRGMMSKMESPYILIADPRLSGGAYYLGSRTFENRLAQKIEEKLALLGFQKKDLILSGLSMGTFGALYYSARLAPQSVIIGKPLASIGSAARYTHIHRPGSEALHNILYLHTGGVSENDAEALDGRFWGAFLAGNFQETQFMIAYMMEDDIDGTAFSKLSEALSKRSSQTKVLSKGLVGRHNDDTPGIVAWFLRHYQSVYENEFGR
jgi:accessory secretory protein Asp2